ncbi:hypothetical protein B0H13DRAFT_1881671 [Mycena leptocephala]|nr:hypothetical protein B0H13DRAFT_1881671 [Mycena leptocephala]
MSATSSTPHATLALPSSVGDFPIPPSVPKWSRMYAHSTRSMYGMSSVISMRTISAAVVPVRAFRRQTIYEESIVVVPPPKSSWLKKIIPGLFRRPKAATRLSVQLSGMPPTGAEEQDHAPLVQDSRPMRSNPANLRTGSAKSNKLKSKSGKKSTWAGIENRAIRGQHLRRSRSFSGFVYSPEDEEELDENMDEVREALRVNAALHARGYRYQPLHAAQMRHLEQFIDHDGVGGL